MKQITLLAVGACLCASAVMAFTPVKKTKKAKTTPQTQIAVCYSALSTPSDTASYIAGKAMTDGLLPYLQRQLGVDTAYMADFESSLKQSLTQVNNPAFKARMAGQQVAMMLKERMLPTVKKEFESRPDSINESRFFQGFMASLDKDNTLYTDSAAQALFTARRKAVQEAKAAAERKAGEDWLAQNKTKEGVVTLPDGLQYKILVKGNGPVPKADDEVKVKYEGKLIDGTVFDSSYKRNPQTSTFKANQVIKGWTEALTMMPVGSTWELYIPQQLAYGERQAGQIKPYSTLIFKVELVEIVQPKAQEDKAPAKNTAKKALKKAKKGKK